MGELKLQPEVPTQYIPPAVCRSPTLPSNSTLKFPDSLLPAIQAFRDRSKDMRSRKASQKLVERYLVERGSCSQLNPSIVQDARIRLFSLDSELLDSVLTNKNALNANIHDKIACSMDAIIYDSKLKGSFTPSQRERIRNWFTDIKQIGSASVEAYAFKSSFTSDTNLFVIKVPQNPKNDELVHEALIGFYALNKLRHVLPNFMYVYGYAKCSPPAVDNREVATWCSSSNPGVSYLILENIRDSVPIGEFVTAPDVTPLDVAAVWYQVINALNLAYKYYGYTHYDLHYENVLVRKYPSLVAIPYLGTNNKVVGYLVTQYVPYIIDYGYNRITVGGIGFGKIGLEAYGLETERPFPMFDTYKLLGFLGERLYARPHTSYYQAISQLLETLFSFFREGTLLQRVQRRISSNADWYSVSDKYRGVTHDTYLTWMQTVSGILNPIHADISSLGAQGIYPAPINTAIDTCSFYDLVTSDKGPESSLEYCEVVTALDSDSVMTSDIKQKALNWLKSRFNANDYFLRTINNVETEAQEIAMIRARRNIESGNIIPRLTLSTDIRSIEFVDRYRAHIFDLLRIKDLISTIISYIKSSICSLTNQGTYTIHQTRINRLNTLTIEWVQFLNRQRAILKQNFIFVSSINWSQLRIPKMVTNFWTVEHENLILAV